VSEDLKSKMNEESTGYLLYHLTIVVERKIKRELDKLDITHTQFIVLANIYRLSDNKKTLTQIDIANESKMDKMMVSKILRTLQTKELVTREEHTTDTRAKTILITQSGKALLKKAFEKVKNVESSFFEPIQKTKVDFNNSIKLLLKFNQE
jgi:DNA-binding MarR family transcriptional regulator